MTFFYRALVPMALAALRCSQAEEPHEAWKSTSAEQGLRQAYEGVAYKLRDSGRGSYQGTSPAQGLALEFSSSEARLVGSEPLARVGFRLQGYGYGDRLLTPLPAKLSGTGSRVEYLRGGITEWYVNQPGGLEQGFTLTERPGTAGTGESLVIALGVTGGLVPVLGESGATVLLQAGQQTVLRYTGLHAWDSRGRQLTARLEVRQREIHLVLEDGQAEYPVVVDPVVTLNEQFKLTPPDGATGDYFGVAVAVSGGTAIVGAYSKTINSNANQGAAYVFAQSGGSWILQAELVAPDGTAGNYFGYSVALSGTTAVVGAYGSGGRGAAYVFVQSGSGWVAQAKLTASDGSLGDYFGFSVGLSGTTAVVGACGATVNANPTQGAAYVFVQNGGTWNQQAKLTAAHGAATDYFGHSVAVSGGTALVGAFGRTVNTNSYQGAAYVFAQSGGTWVEQAELTAVDGAAADSFGYSVAVSGTTALVGAYGKAVNSNSYEGAAYVFVQSGATWNQQAELIPNDGATADYFGISVAVSGNMAVVGANSKTVNSNLDQGSAYIFTGSAAGWSQQATLTPSDGAASDQFGVSVAVSGSTVVVGAQGETIASRSNLGAAYMFQATNPGAPFGSFDTPVTNTAVSGSVGFTGWALATSGISSVDIWREPNPGEATQPNGLVFIGTGIPVAGARPDVQALYPGYPGSASAGWGYLMLTNLLPNSSGNGGVGNGTYRFHALAHDNAGDTTDLGVKTIVIDNADAVAPFGVIDTPAQGGTASGSAYVNFGWALAPPGDLIPMDGSTMWVFVDGQPLGHPVYNQFRSDIAGLFPNSANSQGAAAYFYIDTTQLANGLHSIAWSVTDVQGHTSGIGSRLFFVQN